MKNRLMNLFAPVWRRLVVLLSILLLTGNAHAMLFSIDPAKSSLQLIYGGFTICDWDGNCTSPPEPKSFSISGTFSASQEALDPFSMSLPWLPSLSPSYYEGLRSIVFSAVDVDLDGADLLGFVFPSFPGNIRNGNIRGIEGCLFTDLCIAYIDETGKPIPSYSGALDGDQLILAGTFSLTSMTRFSYSIYAQAVNVPAPGTLACLGIALVSLLALNSFGPRRGAGVRAA